MFSLHGHYYYSHHAHSSVILCLSNDDNNEACSLSAPTTDAQNIHLTPHPHHSNCLITIFSLFQFLFSSFQSSHSSTNWSSLLSISIFFRSVSFERHKWFGSQFGPSVLCTEKITAVLTGLLWISTKLLRWPRLHKIYKTLTEYLTRGLSLSKPCFYNEVFTLFVHGGAHTITNVLKVFLVLF